MNGAKQLYLGTIEAIRGGRRFKQGIGNIFTAASGSRLAMAGLLGTGALATGALYYGAKKAGEEKAVQDLSILNQLPPRYSKWRA